MAGFFNTAAPRPAARPRATASAIILTLALVAGAARAEDTSEADKLREQLRSTVLQLRELQDQQAAAKSTASAPTATTTPDVAALKLQLARTQSRLRAAQAAAADAATARADADKAKADLAALQTSDAATQAELEKFKSAYSQAADAGRALTAERDLLKAQLATQITIAQACQVKNQRLTIFAEGLLDTYNHVTFGQKLMAAEPVFGFTRVHLENIAQEREDAIRVQHCDPRVDSAPPKAAAK